jgi:hypothetical protein
MIEFLDWWVASGWRVLWITLVVFGGAFLVEEIIANICKTFGRKGK